MDEQKDSPADSTMKFEEALARLEAVVAEMEGGKQSLEDSVKAFEEGMKLTKFCADKLAETEKKIEVLVKRADRSLDWEPMEARELGGTSEDDNAP